MRTAQATLALLLTLSLAMVGISQLSGAPPQNTKAAAVLAKAAPSKPSLASADNPPRGVGKGDWGQWGGSSVRNNTPEGKNIPSEWNIGSFDAKTGKWNKDEAEKVIWVSSLGSQS